MNSLVTIIVPSFNPREYLLLSIQSLLVQSYREFEIIIINDGSEDAYNKYYSQVVSLDPRIRYVRYNINRGGGHARNVGLMHARGD